MGRASVLSWKPRRWSTYSSPGSASSSSFISSSPRRATVVAPAMTTRPAVRAGWRIANQVAAIEPIEWPPMTADDSPTASMNRATPHTRSAS
jgi:hypothetical protein